MASGELTLSDLGPARNTAVSTRDKLGKTRLGEGVARVNVDTESATLVTRRNALLRRRRRKRLLIGIALILALFPPMWAVYLVAWLVWRSRPRQRSMRGVQKAISALEKNQSGIALKRLQDAHLQDPANTDALYWLGLLLARQGRYDEAEEALSIVADRVPGLPEVDDALVEAYIALEQPDAAIYHAQRLFNSAPHQPESLLKLAAAFEAVGKLDLAIDALNQAPLHMRVLTEPLKDIHYQLGRLYDAKGDRTQAQHHFERVYARDISYKDIRSRVGGGALPEPRK